MPAAGLQLGIEHQAQVADPVGVDGEPAALAAAAIELTDSHGRVHVISPDVAALHTGHGNVMPQSLHGVSGARRSDEPTTRRQA